MKQLLSILIISVILVGCKGGGKPIASKLKLVAFEQLPEDEPGVLSAEIGNLFFPTLCDCKENSPVVFDSHIYRVDTSGTQEVFNHQKVAQFAGDKSKISFWKNKAKSLNSVALAPVLLLPKNGKDVKLKLDKFVSEKTKNDSILIYIEDNSINKGYAINNKVYLAFNNLDSLKASMVRIISKNKNANFTVFYNPPLAESINDEEQESEDVVIEKPIKKTSKSSIASTEVIISKKTKIERVEGKKVLVEETSSESKSSKKKWIGDKRTLNEVKNGVISEKEVKE